MIQVVNQVVVNASSIDIIETYTNVVITGRGAKLIKMMDLVPADVDIAVV